MKKLALLFAAMVVVLSTSCGSSAKREQEIRDSLRADSIKKDSIIRAKIDSIRKDSMWRYRVTPDLATFELHGPVKSVSSRKITTEEYDYLCLNVSFSESGNAQRVSGQDNVYTISRDNQNRIKSVTHLESYDGVVFRRKVYTYKYYDVGYLQNEKYQDYNDEWNIDISSDYDSNGNIVKEVINITTSGDCYRGTSKYKITEQDEFGNWIKRIKTTTYFIEAYYEDWEDSKGTKTVTETRTITYYEK